MEDYRKNPYSLLFVSEGMTADAQVEMFDLDKVS